MARSRSGLASASCSSSQPVTSILGPAAIAWLLLIEIFGRNSNENHAMAVSPHDATLTSGNIEHHIGGRNPTDWGYIPALLLVMKIAAWAVAYAGCKAG